MPRSNYIKFTVGGRDVDIDKTDNIAIPIDYELETADNFQQKSASTALDIKVPATLENDKTFGSFHDPSVESNSVKNAQDVLIEAGGMQLFKGKALITAANRQNGKPVSYELDCYGNNGDWMIPFQDKTLHDFVNPVTHSLTEATVIGSWMSFNGMSEVNDFVYAPVRYRTPFSENDTRVDTLQLRPSISIYWILYRAFKSLGYKIESNFMDSSYFRRMVMPWTWGDFLFMNSARLDPLKFKATGPVDPVGSTTGNSYFYLQNQTTNHDLGSGALGAPNHDSFSMANDTAPLGFDNGNNYTWDNGIMRWVYNTNPGNALGMVNVRFRLSLPAALDGTASIGSPGNVDLQLMHRRNGGAWSEIVREGTGTHLYYDDDNGNLKNDPMEFFVTNVNPGDVLEFKITCNMSTSGPFQSAVCAVWARSGFNPNNVNPGGVTQEAYFETIGFYKTIGSVVDLKLYDEFKNYKILDLIRGLIDCFDWLIQTDNISKVVKIEPAYPYYLSNNPSSKVEGYFNGGKIDWSQKLDHSKISTVELYRDLEQELTFRFKDDGNDGGSKIFNERYGQILGAAKYLFPSRFKQGKKENENRFFGPTMHVDMEQWRTFTLGKVAPQIIALIPENISTTSASVSSEFKFDPRIAYYKGLDLYGGEFVNGRFNFNGNVVGGVGSYVVPSMFGVNYKPGGHLDPVLTYNDQRINGIVAHGMMRRYYLPRLAIMRYGKRLVAWFKLNNLDIMNWYHREQVIVDNAVYHLYNIYGYKPLADETTQCMLWKYFPITQEDSDSCFPSLSSVAGTGTIGTNDMTYNPAMLLAKDIPQ